MMSRQRFCSIFCFAPVVLALIASSGCASSPQTTSEDESASTAEQAALGAKINACAIQRVRLQGAEVQRRKFLQLIRTVERLLAPDKAAANERARLGRTYNWASELDPSSLHDIRLTLDAGGIRIDGSARSYAGVAEFFYRLSTLFPSELTLAEASRSSAQQIDFQIAEAYRLTTPFGGGGFDEKLFPPRNGRSLEEYAADLCDFGDDSPPKVPEGLDGVEFEQLSATRDGWLHPTLRARVPSNHIHTVMGAVEDYDGVTVRLDGDQAVVDLFRTKPAADFDARKWLETLIKANGVAHDHALNSPPDFDELITWQEEREFPVDVSRAMLGNLSWYRYQRIHRLYRQIAENHARVSLANKLWERNARGLRASLCLTRAYSAPAGNLPQSQTRPLKAGKLSFSVPIDGVVDDLHVERITLDVDGRTEWQFSSPEGATLSEVQQALAVCMNAPDLTASRSDEDQTSRLSGTATAPFAGVFEPMEGTDEVPRYEDGLAFVLGIRDGNHSELTSKLYAIRNQQQSSQNAQRLFNVAPSKADVDLLVRDLIELTQVYQVDLRDIHNHAISASGWEHMRPFVVELQAEASPADMLAFVTQLFDLDRALIPADITITAGDSPNRLKIHAKFYAFFID